jgi:O-antigen ligase
MHLRVVAQTWARMRRARLHSRILAEIAICVMPAMTVVGFGSLHAGSRWLFGSTLLMLAYHFINRKLLDTIVLLLALTPAMMLLRGSFYYSAPILLSVGAVVLLLSRSPEELDNLKKNKLLVGLLLFAVLYWWLSFFKTASYSSNMRFLELSFAAASVCLLANFRSYLATALAGLALSSFCVAAALLPYGDRLGVGQVEDVSIGNPITLGLSATLVLLFVVVDRGRWLFVDEHPVWQALLAVLATASLALSTSRGSWLVALLGFLIILLFNRGSRKLLIGTVMAAAIMVATLLQTSRGPVIRHYFNNATAADESLAKRTTGRADQWQSFPRVFADSPIWGFGPGSGKSVSLRYTLEGKPWHSLYLLIGTEAGLIGFVCLALFLGILMRRGFVHWRSYGELGPLLALFCFMFIGVSVSGIDAISGIFLGLAFLGNNSPMRLRTVARLKVLNLSSGVEGPMQRPFGAYN